MIAIDEVLAEAPQDLRAAGAERPSLLELDAHLLVFAGLEQ